MPISVQHEEEEEADSEARRRKKEEREEGGDGKDAGKTVIKLLHMPHVRRI